MCIIVLISVLHAIPFSSRNDRLKSFTRSLLIYAILLSVLGIVNEYGVKPALKVPRSIHSFILAKTNSKEPLDSIYKLPAIDRKRFFQQLLDSDTVHFQQIDNRILQHWVNESGYSFPSGHTFNAFLIGSFLAFSLYRFNTRAVRMLYAVPLLWACAVGISRVLLAAHSAVDVTVGAGMGLLVSHLLLTLPRSRDWLIPKILHR